MLPVRDPSAVPLESQHAVHEKISVVDPLVEFWR